MSTVFIFMGLLALGYIYGVWIRKNNRQKFLYASFVENFLIYTNVLIIGVRIGLENEIMDDLWHIGFISVMFTIFVQAFGIIVTCVGRKFFGFDKYGIKHKNKNFLFEKESEDNKNVVLNEDKSKENKLNYMTIMILFLAIFGIIIGHKVFYKLIYDKILFDGNIEKLNDSISLLVKCVVGTLMVLIGIDLGFDENTIKNVKMTGIEVVLFPIFEIIGSTIGTILCSLIFKIQIFEGLAIGEGYTWFSLAPSLILSYGLTMAGAISFLHNVLREIFAFIFVPFVAKNVGYIEAITLGGAASMDDCMPINERATSPLVAIYGFVCGIILTAVVPILVPFFATLATR